jgi:hypothetical protein
METLSDVVLMTGGVLFALLVARCLYFEFRYLRRRRQWRRDMEAIKPAHEWWGKR